MISNKFCMSVCFVFVLFCRGSFWDGSWESENKNLKAICCILFVKRLPTLGRTLSVSVMYLR